MMSKTAILALAAIASMSGVMAHSKALLVTGDNGVTTPGFANDPNACLGPERKCQQDTVIFTKAKGRRGLLGLYDRARGAAATSAAPGCGKTKGAGVVDCATELSKVEAAGDLPSCGAAGTVAITMHQLNGDGAGPFAMFVNTDGTGNTWTAMTVTTQVPGTRGRSNAKATDFPLVGQMPAGTKCTGGADGQTCLVQAQNPVGPFGGVVAVTQAQALAAAAVAPAAAVPVAGGTIAGTAPAASSLVQAAPIAGSTVQAAPLAASVVQASPAVATVAQAAPAIATVAQAAPLAVDPLTAATDASDASDALDRRSSGSGWTELSIAGRKRAYRRKVAAEEDACDDAETGDAYC